MHLLINQLLSSNLFGSSLSLPFSPSVLHCLSLGRNCVWCCLYITDFVLMMKLSNLASASHRCFNKVSSKVSLWSLWDWFCEYVLWCPASYKSKGSVDYSLAVCNKNFAVLVEVVQREKTRFLKSHVLTHILAHTHIHCQGMHTQFADYSLLYMLPSVTPMRKLNPLFFTCSIQ